jgi:hypothetical protein
MFRPTRLDSFYSLRRHAAASVLFAALLAALALPAAAQRDASVRLQNLGELVAEAETIFVGKVVAVRAEPHPQFNNITTVVVTLQVDEVLKGQASQQFTFRQFVNHPLDYKEKLNYGGGQEVLLMMIKPSQYGLSSPAGLEQGRFRITRDAQGNRYVANGLNNGGLFYNVQKTAPKLESQLASPARQVLTEHKSGPIPFDQFKSIVQTLVANPQ